MSKINILPAQVYNRIAAGEVVDRPYSVVKELVENAIDAGATEIDIYIERGGKQLVRVVDNGCGIARDDLHAAFLPHATSKISKASDLDNIATLGFRGEAVASIASVSKMTITSKTADGKCYSLTSDGGKLGEITEVAAAAVGTDVQVEMLFFNTPVRLGFLKTDKGEETEILSYVSRFVLNRADIAFRCYVNGKRVIQSFGDGDEAALVAVYGHSILENCIKVQAERHGIRVSGYIGKQNFFKANKTYQSIFLNGRYIDNKTISTALAQAYASYMMKRQYPFFVLHVNVPTEIVDVNVHPNKADVRFADNRLIFGCIMKIVSDVLDGTATAKEYVVEHSTPLPPPSYFEPFESPFGGSFAEPKKEVRTDDKKSGTGFAPLVGSGGSVDRKTGFAFTYEDALREMEKSAPAFTAKKRGEDIPELPFDLSAKSDKKEEKKEQKPVGAMESAELEASRMATAKDGLVVFNGKYVGNNQGRTGAGLKDVFPGLTVNRSGLRVKDPHAAAPDSFDAALRVETMLKSEGVAPKETYAAILDETSGKSEESKERTAGNEAIPTDGYEKEPYHKDAYTYESEAYEEEKEREEVVSVDSAAVSADDGIDYFAENKRFLEAQEAKAKQNRIEITSCRYAGKLFNTYLIYERADDFFLIDQHAAHERLIFDSLKEQMKNRKVLQQPMLLPYNLELNRVEGAFIAENLSVIREIGFDIEEFGDNAFKVSAVPLDLQGMNLDKFFGEILSDVGGFKGIKLEEILKDKLATAACKAAVKGGMDLTKEEVDLLFEKMDGDMGLKCPHGRPVVVRMTKTQLEKMFKRIV